MAPSNLSPQEITQEISHGDHDPVVACARRNTLSGEVHWRDDITSLVFPVVGHGAICAVHRGAFRTLLGAEPTPEACLGHFRRFEAAFRAAADAKIVRRGILPGVSLHLTSRDIARKLLEDAQIANGE